MGDMTVMAWVKLDAGTFPDRTTNWTILDCEHHKKTGFILRIEGHSTRLYYRSSQAGVYQHAWGRKLKNRTYYHLVLTRAGESVTLYVDGVAGKKSFTVKNPALPARALHVGGKYQSFLGEMDDVKIYSGALSPEHIVNAYKKHAALYGK